MWNHFYMAHNNLMAHTLLSSNHLSIVKIYYSGNITGQRNRTRMAWFSSCRVRSFGHHILGIEIKQLTMAINTYDMFWAFKRKYVSSIRIYFYVWHLFITSPDYTTQMTHIIWWIILWVCPILWNYFNWNQKLIKCVKLI